MQCTSHIPVYYHARDLNVGGGSGFSWHVFDGNANCGEEKGYNIAMPPYNMELYVGYDKEVLKQMIQNHEATFRYQVQELHRLYRRQRELMDEVRVREIFAQHLLSQTSESVRSLSHARPEFSQRPSQAMSWLLSEVKTENIQRHSSFVAENFQQCTTARPDSFIQQNSFKDVNFLSSISKRSENRIVDLELPAYTYHDNHVKQFKEGSTSEPPKELLNFKLESDSDIGSVKTGVSSSFILNSRKTNSFIDLNQPIQLETCHMEIMLNDSCVPVEAPKSVVPKCSGLLNCDDNSHGRNSSMAIDLNSLPMSCFSENEVTPVENLQSVKMETTELLDYSSAYDHAMKDENCVEDHPIVQEMHDKFLKTDIDIDLNSGVVDEHSPPLSSSVLQIRSAEDTELKGPESPENEECSPPRGNSEDIQVETPLLSEQGEGGEPCVELDTIAARTLVKMISSLGEMNSASLCWFAEIVSSTGDDLENEIMKLENGAADIGRGEVKALKLSHVKKERVTCPLSSRSGKRCTKGTKQRKDLQTEALPSVVSLSKDLHAIEGLVETGPLRKKVGKKACGKSRRYSKLSPSDAVKKSTSWDLQQQGVVQCWGKIRKRQGGRRRRATKFLLIS